MFTFSYRGYFIHTCFDKQECRFAREFEGQRKAKSVHSAKCLITREINSAKEAA